MSVAGKENDNGVVEFQFYRPENRTKWQSFRSAIYDPSSKQCLGRTPKSWGQLLLFYSIFYIILAALFAICLQGLFATLDVSAPKWKLESSLIGNNPGLGFRPNPSNTAEGSLIAYNLTNGTTYQKWVDLIDEFLEPYKNSTGKNVVSCNFDKDPKPGEVCEASVNAFKNCTSSNNYGYGTQSPCIFLKLNRIYDWEPDYYTEPDPRMPQDLQDYINNITNPRERRQIWVTCNGMDAVDREQRVKRFIYEPRGFPGYYYPYKNYPNYMSPIVAVTLGGVTPNQMIAIECRAWAKNIEVRISSLNRAGCVTFEVQVDTAPPLDQNSTAQS